MRYHPSQTPDGLRRRGPAHLALQVASEFWRIQEGAEFCDDSIQSYHRARELMEVLEGCLMSAEVVSYVKPFYLECGIDHPLVKGQLTMDDTKRFGQRLAEAFEMTAKKLIEGPHA
jgi:hypothetical protein